MTDAYIYEAIRSPRGKGQAASDIKVGGSLASIQPCDLVGQLINKLPERTNAAVFEAIESLTLGCVGQVGAQGGHIALVSRLASDLPNTVPVKTINNYCVSGLTAVIDGALNVMGGLEGFVLAGGVESLSHVGFLADQASYYMDPDLGYAPPLMGAELIATLEGYKKEDLDVLTLHSHQKAEAAWNAGFYNTHVIPIKSKDNNVVLDKDELIRPGMTLEKLAALPAVFSKIGRHYEDRVIEDLGRLDEVSYLHSIANCPGLADGAALVLIGSLESGAAVGLKPRAKITAFHEAADDPVLQLTAGFKAMEIVLAKRHLKLADIDRIEFMEAFAALPHKFLTDFDVDPTKVNVNGGHLAMGHPMGATGAILLTSVLYELEKSDLKTGLVVTQAGGGIGSALLIERV